MSRCVVFALIVYFVAGCSEPRITSEPARIALTLSDAERDALSPESRRLYIELVAGKLSGARASEFQRDLDTADDIIGTRRGPFTTYRFRLAPHRSKQQPPPEEKYVVSPMMFVRVQNAYDHIVVCGITTPVW